MKKIDLINTPLEGSNLIEASAGTGKTYTITNLFLRLLIEKNFPVEKILVVTFTEAATQELKNRIRIRLGEAVKAFSIGYSDDIYLNRLLNKYLDKEDILYKLKNGIRSFDLAAVFTIHGFCLRILVENAFETGSVFDTKLVTNQEELKKSICEDFWRIHFYNASNLFVNFVIERKFNTESLFDFLRNYMPGQNCKVIPDVNIPDTTIEEERFITASNKLKSLWRKNRQQVKEILLNYDGLNRTKYKKSSIHKWIEEMDDYTNQESLYAFLFKGFNKFTSSSISTSLKKGFSLPEHEFFNFCENFNNIQENLTNVFLRKLIGIKKDFFNYAEEQLSLRKSKQNIHYFDDLLIKLHNSIESKNNKNILKETRHKYSAALIDEFQDTDPIQYKIFKKIFTENKSPMFLIGDPKQAIYGFRGADIFAYINASKNADNRYTLSDNWRSEPELLNGINTIFKIADNPFVFKDINFEPVNSPEEKIHEKLLIDNKPSSGLHLWFIEPESVNKPDYGMTKKYLNKIIPDAVAMEISRLISLGLEKRALIGVKPLQQGDIAVLVRKNSEALLLQKSLSKFNIKSVLNTTENLFDSREAGEMEKLLNSILFPGNLKYLKASLTTDFMGLKGEDFLIAEKNMIESYLVNFSQYHNTWRNHGFMRMFRDIISKEKIYDRLIIFPDGERRITNIIHLTEVLNRISVENNPGMEGLVKWLSIQINQTNNQLDEHQIRLESDKNAVRILTIHKSKGLEYPVVFCPFTWESSKVRKGSDSISFHDEQDGMNLTIDLGSDDIEKNISSAEKEILAENIRLLYVALTRSRNLCYFTWGKIKNAETSAPSYLLHQPDGSLSERSLNDDLIKNTEKRYKVLTGKDLRSDIDILGKEANGSINISNIRTDEKYSFTLPVEKHLKLSCRKFAGNIDRNWSISSFSSIVSTISHIYETDDFNSFDYLAEDSITGNGVNVDIEKPGDIFTFPKGVKPGTFFHELFEHLDFTNNDNSYLKIFVSDKLIEYGYEESWNTIVCEMIQKIMSSRLDSEVDDLVLSSISDRHRINEMEFYFPINTNKKNIKRVFNKYGPDIPGDFPDQIEKLELAPIKGFMKGFIDLVFKFGDKYYIVDWKSNYLGGCIKDYNVNAMMNTMLKEFYFLQYHIYCVALNLYLKKRIPEYSYDKNFGGVFYIFLRGIDPSKDINMGIYRDKPSQELIRSLCYELTGFTL
ncbi:MAG: exodeoxyribonuclease V subunit beta [Desulfobacterales bacterium]|nr:exodeoxyribonuclease V subunit beta [Desulfobacteraceae bacterium]MBT7086678.1 exodeoxyribonuclease V subunit beta [Desulfobacterales bacterium]